MWSFMVDFFCGVGGFETRTSRPFGIEYSGRAGIIPSAERKNFSRPRGNKTNSARVIIQMDASASPVPPTFEHLMLPHLDAAYNLARWLLRDAHDAEDAVQDAFLRAHRAFARFRGDDGRAWLLTIVRHTCYSRLRQNHREPAPEIFDDETHGSAHDPA